MSLIKNKDSNIETTFRKLFWKKGFRYRKNSNKYFGKPDLVLKRLKTVIFIDSCFWHGCKKHCRIPTSRKNYWIEKMRKNIKRDKIVTKYYRNIGWKIFRVWEHELVKNPKNTVQKIYKTIESIALTHPKIISHALPEQLSSKIL